MGEGGHIAKGHPKKRRELEAWPFFCVKSILSLTDTLTMADPSTYVVAFDCGGIFANDIPVDMFKKLAKDHYKEEDQPRVSDIHARKFVARFFVALPVRF